MAKFELAKSTTVEQFNKAFNEAFGANVRVYQGRRCTEGNVTLGECGLTNEGVFECRASLTSGSFIERMQNEFGLKVKVYTCDYWVAVLDGLTLESAGKVKKCAVKADMEGMLAYQRSESEENVTPAPVTNIKKSASFEDYTINIASNNSVTVLKGGVVCDNAKSALREIAAAFGLVFDADWTTQQLGNKLTDAIKSKSSTTDTVETTIVTTEVEAEKAEAEAAKLKAELAAAEKAKAKAEAAQAEIARLKAEAEQMRAEAEKARQAAEKFKGELEQVGATVELRSSAGELPGIFTINDKGDKIRFSSGLLQFNPVKYEFRFADTQYTIIGKDNEKIAPNYDGWIDLFGWGTSGYMGCQPTEISTNKSEYGPSNGDIAGTNYDWGVYNPITNGGNKEGIWRTPTKDEWNYLVRGRPNATKLKVWCTVCGIEGWMLMPDDFWNNRIRIPIDITTSNCSTNTYNAEQWSQLEALGVVFMPRIGYRRERKFSFDILVVWLSTRSIIDGDACAGSNSGDFGKGRHYGLGVRLIKDVK